MTIEEKKYFQEAISLQVQRYNGCIDNNVRYKGTVDSCPICATYLNYEAHQHRSHKDGPCGKCPMFHFNQNNFDDDPGYPCSFRLTYPDKLIEFIISYANWKTLIYEMEAEIYAHNFWVGLGRLVRRTSAKNIDLSENSRFVMQMFMLDKKIRAIAEEDIDQKYKPTK